MGTQNAFSFDPELSPIAGAADTRPVQSPSWGSQIAASFRTGRDDIPYSMEARRIDAYRDLSDAVLRHPMLNGQDKIGLILNRPTGAMTDNINERGYAAIWKAITNIRAKDPKAFQDQPGTQDEFDKRFGDQFRARHAKDEQVVQNSSTLPWLIGSFGAGMTDPINVMTMGSGGAARTIAGAVLREAAVNAGTELIEQPMINAERQRQGRPEMTTAERVSGVAVAGLIGGSVPAIGHVAGKGIEAASKAIVPDDVRLARAFRESTSGPWELTPEQAAAVHVVDREARIDGASPYRGTWDALRRHSEKITAAAAQMSGMPLPRKTQPASGVADYLAAVRRSESGGNPNARNSMPGQTASGLYGFTNGTWLTIYKREFPNSGMSDSAILARKGEPALQEQLMRRLTQDNAYFLRQHDMPDNPGNLYVVHHLGQGDAARVFSARQETPLRSILPERVIAANPYLDKMTAGQFLDWAHERMGGERSTSGASTTIVSDDGGDAVLAALDRQADDLAAQQARLDAEPVERADNRMMPMDDMDIETPKLARDLFPDETTWRIAQAQSDADLLGLPEPLLSRQSVWDDARAQLMAAQGGQVEGALYHPEIGPIDVAWGDGRSGLSRIAETEQDAIGQLSDNIAQMNVQSRSDNRVLLARPDGGVTAQLSYDASAGKWALESYGRQSAAPRAAAGGGTKGAAADAGAPMIPDDLMHIARPWGVSKEGVATPDLLRFETPQGPVVWRPASGDVTHPGGRMTGATVNDVRRLVSEPSPASADVMARFDDPSGDGVAAVADTLWHDIAADMDEAGRAAMMVDLDDGRGPRSVADIEQELAAEQAAIDAARGCL